MLVAISHESFWIDEFWSAYFASLESFRQLVDLLMIPSGSQTPFHFAYGYLWGQFFPLSEAGLRLSNLPLFLLGQASLWWALRAYPRSFAGWLMGLSAMHPMVWQYANELRQYVMMYAGAEMILAYLLHIHAAARSDRRVGMAASAVFVVGSTLLFGASLLGVFWVAAAWVYVAWFHHRHLDWRYLKRGPTLALGLAFIAMSGMLTAYYLSSLLRGGGASRISSTTLATLVFDGYELLGLSGVGPGRLELRDGGFASLGPYWIWLIPIVVVVIAALLIGVREAMLRLGTRGFALAAVLGVLPMAIVVVSGFAMHWRVLGRHMIAELPMLNLVFALGLTRLCRPGDGRGLLLRVTIAVAFSLAFVYSSCSLRFAERHRKDDYLAAAAIAKQELAAGKRVWWAADALGARYYGLPGDFDYLGELTGQHKPPGCEDRPGVQAIAAAPAGCLEKLVSPDVVILSKPETFDANGVIAGYLKNRSFAKVRELPAFTIWRPVPAPAPAPAPSAATSASPATDSRQ